MKTTMRIGVGIFFLGIICTVLFQSNLWNTETRLERCLIEKNPIDTITCFGSSLGDFMTSQSNPKNVSDTTSFAGCGGESACLMHRIQAELRTYGTQVDSLIRISNTCVDQGAREHPSHCAFAMGRSILWVQTYWYIESLLLCDEIYSRFDMRDACWKGVSYENARRNSVAKSALDPYPWEDRDPHYPCEKIPEVYQEACVFEQAKLVREVLFDGDTKKAIAYCQNFSLKKTRNACIESLTQ